jgi:hypothetical protein
MLSLWAQQSARQLLLQLLAAERSKGAHLGSSLEGKDARLHDLDATVRRVACQHCLERSHAGSCRRLLCACNMLPPDPDMCE